jgi:D-alanyl-D-alanine carboxypeptidase
VASLLGRIIRSFTVIAAFWSLALSQTAVAAPFAAIVMDARSGEVLYEKNADTRLHPASLTKMMTLYVVFQEIEAGRLHLDDKVTVSKHAASQPPSRLGLKAGQKIAVRYLIRAAAVKSANDAAAALGDHISGSREEFAKRMTKTARALGMKGTTFKNAHGLTAEGHLSTARDMNTLGRHLFYDFPQYYNIFSRRSADAGIATVNNTNTRFLDSYEGADGIKTGYTVAAGFNLTASAQRGKKRIIATIFGGTSTAARNAKMKELMDLGFGAAGNNVRERVPEAAPIPEEVLVAEAPAAVEGGVGKTIRVSGEVLRSPRPRLRPEAAPEAAPVVVAEVETVPDEVALAIAASVNDALGEALAEPPPEGTLEAQALALAEGTASADEATLAPVPEDLIAEVVAAAPPPEGTFEAQALALAAAGTAADTPLAEAPAAIADPALAALRPLARPDGLAGAAAPEELPFTVAEAPADTPVDIAAAVEAPAAPVEAVVPDDTLVAEATTVTDPTATLPIVTEVETVAAAAVAPLSDVPVEEKPTRNAPIFDTVAPEVELAMAEAPQEQLVVVSKSSSGGRHWGVNVGDYSSRAQAERELLKVALVESATLNQGLRKISEKGGSYHANFMGLTEDQADLACRRLRARGVACETLGPT